MVPRPSPARRHEEVSGSPARPGASAKADERRARLQAGRCWRSQRATSDRHTRSAESASQAPSPTGRSWRLRATERSRGWSQTRTLIDLSWVSPRRRCQTLPHLDCRVIVVGGGDRVRGKSPHRDAVEAGPLFARLVNGFIIRGHASEITMDRHVLPWCGQQARTDQDPAERSRTNVR